ncbi:MAG TPA: primosomal protein N' [Fimbriimonas sp.]|nr:primosomal protein N' [Fimbriimonas sp.]
MELLRLAEVVLDPRSGGSDAVYTYLAPDFVSAGDAVLVPLGKRSLLGYAMRVYEGAGEDLGFDPKHLRPIRCVVRDINLPEPLLAVVRQVATETLCTLPAALSAAVPPGISARLVKSWRRSEAPLDQDVVPLERELLAAIAREGQVLESDDQAETIKKAISSLVDRGLLLEEMSIKPFQKRAVREQELRLTLETQKIEAFLKTEGHRKPAQAVVLMQMVDASGAALTGAEIRAMCGVTDATINALIKSGHLEVVTQQDEKLAPASHQPNTFQKVAIDAISDSVVQNLAKAFLLFGVTGSGKTEVFLRAAGAAMESGRQVLYLVPEIALATQAIGQLRARFGARVAILHSEQTAIERLQNWLKIRSGEASIVLGPRSAVFAPLDNIGLIIMDEEHEGGYKQEQSPRYHARTVARALGKQHSCPVVLGSATPSIESFFEAEQNETNPTDGGLTLLTLPSRAAKAQLPHVVIDDLSLGYKKYAPELFGEELRRSLDATLTAGNQAILFLNRRAYSSFLICRECGHQWSCPSCAVTLSYHRKDGKLRCHHCGYIQNAPEICTACSGTKIKPFGVGTEKVEEYVQEKFPTAKVGRLDRDVTQRKGALEQVLADFRSGDINVLVGTQLVAKGLDFPNVTLVGVIAADVSLNLPDFRASERTYQLLSQVAGRAGRGQKAGHVVIQTFNPEHPAVVLARDHDYTGFYQTLVHERKLAGYPPFNNLVNIVFSSENRDAVVRTSLKVQRTLLAVEEFELLGPVDCVLERINNRWRRHVLIKHPRGANLTPILEAVKQNDDNAVKAVIDVDPYSLM